ncbi:MAM and LDL-receptor class A domain-containing protein 1-like isoform X4 [Portunus trituberculatus]|uniref:MAM and LDL-receptor class A domain-containing protein 1-like isoform X4 n=1 Tax=Portunus trituberculatus TaxID=210409 RepID=UPI001E1CF606|nr:MAM and LDL-receptor class A domain-containing protein 1-like isoform X4 [Portunus trituberculatus]
MAKFSLILFSLGIFISVTKIASQGGQGSQCWELGLENGTLGIKVEGRVVEIRCGEIVIWFDTVATWCVTQRGNTPAPSCITRGCPSLTPPRHGELAYHHRESVVKVTCDPGYTLTTGYDTIACDSGVWNATVPACQGPRSRCGELSLENGKVRISRRGRVAKFRCRKGFIRFDGDRFATCVRQRWNGRIPKCVTSYTSPPVACTFERETCGWTNSPDNHFFWELKSAALLHLSDQNNSPVTDHTLGTAIGQFMSASTGPGGASDGEGKRATLYSPVFKAARRGVACFNFFYHIYGGRGTGELRVYFKPQDTSIEFVAPDFQTSSRSHASWVRQRLVFTNVTQPFQIVIESEGGIVAIDDVMVNYDVLCIIPTCSP